MWVINFQWSSNNIQYKQLLTNNIQIQVYK